MPTIVLIAGPNGAGKSTVGPAIVREVFGVPRLVNADTVARGLNYHAPEAESIAAGRLVLNHMRSLAKQRLDFAYETTLAGRGLGRWIRDLVNEQGYEFGLVYVALPSPDVAIKRVHARHRSGGHFVPELDVHRRFYRSLWNLKHVFMPLANRWLVFLNDQELDKPLDLCAELDPDYGIMVAEPRNWNRVCELFEESESYAE